MEEASQEPKEVQSFSDSRICEELQIACKALNYSTPTRIQQTTLPYTLQRKDIIALAETGSGKTLAFALPLLQQLLDKYICRDKGLLPSLDW